ncbi:MAG: methionyl-tRNA formyltransferase [Chloroflexi bacterium]|nr:methionyl-tRNA formyltransferase [Chloroflexota bacterium]
MMTIEVENLRIIFMGTPEIAVPVLTALVDKGHELVGVYSQPDRQSGRGKRVHPTPVKEAALELGLPMFQPASLRRDEAAQEELASLKADLIVVAAYGLFLPVETFSLPRLKTLNVHPSLLPKYRGPSPVSTAILNGDIETGVTLIQLDEGMDSGPIVAQRTTLIKPGETCDVLTERLFRMGGDLLVEVLPAWANGKIQPKPQDETQVTVTSRLSREDGLVDWSDSAEYIARRIRAYCPWPGTHTIWQGKTVKIIEAIESSEVASASAGAVVALDGGVGVTTGSGVLELRSLQMEGRRPATALDFAQGYKDFIGSQLGT